LVGDHSYDYKDNWMVFWGFSAEPNYVPVYLIYPPHGGETVCDDWFVRVAGADMIPDVNIGRLPAKSAQEAADMVGKIILYESTDNTKDWEKNVLLVADNMAEPSWEIFVPMNEMVAALLPAGFTEPFKGYLLETYGTPAALRAALTAQINDEGALILHYSGHGGEAQWADEGIFEEGYTHLRSDVQTLLANGEQLPFVVSMSCRSGYFADPEIPEFGLPHSLTESLLRPPSKGVVAGFMPTGSTYTEGQEILDQALFAALFTDDVRILGDAIAAAKQTLLANGSYQDVSDTFLLFGDPAMALKIPLPRRPTGVSIESTSQGITITWDTAGDCNGDPVAGYNIYRSTSTDGTYEKLNTALITETTYTDTAGATGTTYYYRVRSVDDQGDESVDTPTFSALAAAMGYGSGKPASTGGGCFIATAGGE
jgi:hypothetical protein